MQNKNIQDEEKYGYSDMLEYNGCAHFTIENICIVTQP
jgi:hypothetical protein